MVGSIDDDRVGGDFQLAQLVGDALDIVVDAADERVVVAVLLPVAEFVERVKRQNLGVRIERFF